jgi:hypothetical protein
LPTVTEIAPDVYRITVFYPAINLQFNHFLVKDHEPLLFHTGLRGMFPEVREGLSKVIDPAQLRWISWSHFESDECGSLKEWMAIAPDAQAACGVVGALVNVNDLQGTRFVFWARRIQSQPASIDSATTRLRNCHMAGMRESCLRRLNALFSALTCFTRTGNVNRSRKRA